MLVTSRAPLRVRGERAHAVGPLELDAGSEAVPPADLARVPAVRLFMERFETSTGLSLTARTAPPWRDLSTARWPAARARTRGPVAQVLTVEDLLRRLTDDVLLSTSRFPRSPERQQTMNATVAWSYQLLNPDEQRAFRHFGALPGLFPIDAAAPSSPVVSLPGRADDALHAAAGLMDKSLLLRAETSVVATCPRTTCSTRCARTQLANSPPR